ncbi:MAG: Mur ligase family protein [Chloroflexi bacterium]|nr:MAG: Mur ligase family protein [Chloroflexota bacterium]TMF74845.1 MAG: Mur ligase family protein [Chloroflexota bacterium]TMF76024.1 MAG: Mur ligase family protein [Chloroflexota bacterium]TMG44117.1 MAG: Mur ligase family protein [Chloroflexota bacterium]
MIRKTAAVWAGKATGALSRVTKRGGGTTLPGDVARAIDPKILTRLAHDLTQGSVVITGTNGKTTTARLVSWLLEGAGHRVVSNRSGANLIFGATAAALNRADANGTLKADWGVFEIDEASLPRAVDEIQPRSTLVLNLFRDQLDRYGELESIAKKIEHALSAQPETGRAILNADDPRVAEIGLSLPTPPLWFGLDDTSIASKTLPHAADARTCPKCGSSLIFDAVYVGHDGVYRCPNQDFARPTPDITATTITLTGFDSLALTIGGTRIEMPLGGLYNCYNVLAAYATACSIGLEAAYIAERLRTFKAAFGRQERVDFRGRHLILVLSKNPAGFNETVRTAVELANGKNFVIGLNDRKADGTDVSWIWDVDFEQLKDRASVVIPAGVRAHDLAVRLKYAGVAAEPPQPDPGKALDQLIKSTNEGDTAFLLCTYTAMLDLRAELVRRGWAQPYWET